MALGSGYRPGISFLTRSHLHYKDVVFRIQNGVQALKRVLGGLYIRLKASLEGHPEVSTFCLS